jgi:hypothetical protein
MKYVLMEIAANLVSLAFASGAIVMAVRGVDGWGWMIVGSLLTTASIKWSNEDKEP